MANVVFGGAYATEIIAAQRVFYNQKWGFTYQILLGAQAISLIWPQAPSQTWHSLS